MRKSIKYCFSALFLMLTTIVSATGLNPLPTSASSDADLHYRGENHNYPNTSTFTITLSINGVVAQSDDIEIGAFCGTECRGSIRLHNYPIVAEHTWLGFLSVRGSGGEIITFKVYNHATDKEFPVLAYSQAFVVDQINGTPDNPVSLALLTSDAFTEITQLPFNETADGFDEVADTFFVDFSYLDTDHNGAKGYWIEITEDGKLTVNLTDCYILIYNNFSLIGQENEEIAGNQNTVSLQVSPGLYYILIDDNGDTTVPFDIKVYFEATSDINNPQNETCIISTNLFNILGQPVAPDTKGIIVKQSLYSNGKIVVEKLLVK